MAGKGLESCINDVTDYIYNVGGFFVSTLSTVTHLYCSGV